MGWPMRLWETRTRQRPGGSRRRPHGADLAPRLRPNLRLDLHKAAEDNHDLTMVWMPNPLKLSLC
jgi:hypothetical protein